MSACAACGTGVRDCCDSAYGSDHQSSCRLVTPGRLPMLLLVDEAHLHQGWIRSREGSDGLVLVCAAGCDLERATTYRVVTGNYLDDRSIDLCPAIPDDQSAAWAH